MPLFKIKSRKTPVKTSKNSIASNGIDLNEGKEKEISPEMMSIIKKTFPLEDYYHPKDESEEMEKLEEASGIDLDNDNEDGESEEHKKKILEKKGLFGAPGLNIFINLKDKKGK